MKVNALNVAETADLLWQSNHEFSANSQKVNLACFHPRFHRQEQQVFTILPCLFHKFETEIMKIVFTTYIPNETIEQTTLLETSVKWTILKIKSGK